MHGSSFHWCEVFCLCAWWFTYVRRRPLLLIGCNYLFPLIPAGTSMWAMAYWTENRKRPFIIHVVSAFPLPPPRTVSHFPQTPPQPSVCVNINNGAWCRKWNCAPPAQRRQDAWLHLKGAAASPRLTSLVVWWEKRREQMSCVKHVTESAFIHLQSRDELQQSTTFYYNIIFLPICLLCAKKKRKGLFCHSCNAVIFIEKLF